MLRMLLQGKLMFAVAVVAPLLRSLIEFLKMYLRIFVSVSVFECRLHAAATSCRATISFHIFWLFLVANTKSIHIQDTLESDRERERE